VSLDRSAIVFLGHPDLERLSFLHLSPLFWANSPE
jgi:hypothetical protein